MGYKDVYAAWKADPEAFWMEQAQAIDWDEAPKQALFDRGGDMYDWFAEAKVNTCWNAVDRHVAAGCGDQVAIIHDSPITDSITKITYAELQTRVARLAGALKAQGIEKGDRVIIYMPMVPEALEAMLACARIGAVHSVVFGGFAANELAVRIDDATPKAIIAAYLSFFPVVVGMVKGLRSPDRMQLDLLKTYNSSAPQSLLKLRLPASLPYLFASLKIGIAASLVGAIVGELPTGAVRGLGARLLAGSYYGQTVQIWSALFMAAIVAASLVALVGLIQRLTLKKMGMS